MEKRMNLFAMVVLLAGCLMPVAFVQAASTASGSSIDALSIYSLQVNPNPVFAGSNVTINLQLYDSYTSTLQNINLELEGSYPIMNFSPTNPYLISSIGQGLYGGSDTYFTYKIRIPENTPSGNYTLDLVASYQTVETVSGQSTTVTGTSVMPITFYVHGTPQLSVNPSVSGITPGQTSQISMDVMNSGYGTARNITIYALNASNFSTVGTKVFSLGSLAAGQSASLEADYLVGSHILNGTYSLPLRAVYYSDEGQRYESTINQSISVRIQNPNIVVTILSADPQTLYSGYNQSLLLNIQNIGLGNANNVTVDTSSGSGINLLSSIHDFFIGSLAAGQSQTETLLISAGNYTGGQSSINADISYYSDNYHFLFSKHQAINVSIAPSSIFEISGGSYTVVPGDTSVPIRFTITNNGNVEAQQVQLSFQSSYPVTPVTSSAYIQSLMPGQSANMTFLVSIDSHGTAGSYPVTIYESWRQPNGAVQQSYTGSNNYYLSVSQSAGGSGAITYVIYAVVIVAIVLVAYRRLSKRGAKKKTPKAL